MSEKIRLDRKIGFQNTFYTKCINVIIDSIGPSIILRSIHITWAAGFSHSKLVTKKDFTETFHNRCAFSMKLARFAVNTSQ